MTELVRCPFCGAGAVMMHSDAYGWWQVECSNGECDVIMLEKSSEAKATQSWNRRALPTVALAASHIDDATICMNHDGYSGLSANCPTCSGQPIGVKP